MCLRKIGWKEGCYGVVKSCGPGGKSHPRATELSQISRGLAWDTGAGV